jgi:PAS domain S-box-containing protein
VSGLEPGAELARLARDHAFRNSLGEGVYVLDADGGLLEINPAGERLLGWPKVELRGRNMHAAIHHTRADGSPFPEAECPLLGVLRSGIDFAESDDAFVRRDGSLLPVAYVSSPVVVGEDIVGAVLAFWPR